MGRLPYASKPEFQAVPQEHQVIKPYCRITYWKDGQACGCDDAWTRAELYGPTSRWPMLDYANDFIGVAGMDIIQEMMLDAYNAGRRDAQAHIRKAIGVNGE